MYLLQKRSVIDIATIERRGGVGGFVAPVPLEERFSQWMSEKEITVMTFLASLVGERMFFEGDNSNGVAGDLQSATAIVTEGMAFVGMGNTLASRSVTVAGLQGVTGRPEDGADRHLFDTAFGEKVEAKLAELYERTEALLREHRWFVLGIAHALEQHLTITGEDIDAIFKGRNGPVVNGWQYHTDDFKLSYEAYHLSALEAHKGQTKPNRALPVLSPNQNGTSASHGMFGTQQFEPPAPPATPPQP
jgi:ATP-dependent Zn protease